MPIAQDVLEMAARAAEEAEVYHVSYEETPVSFEGNRLKSILTRQSEGLALRIVKGGRIGFAANMGELGWEDLLSRALETAQFGAEARFHLPSIGSHSSVEVYDPAVAAFPL